MSNAERVAIVVRPADRAQASALARLQLGTALAAYERIFPDEAPKPTYDDLLAQWERWLSPGAEPGLRVFVAEDGDAVVGVAIASGDATADGVGHLSRLYVDPRRWGQGVGSRLYWAALEHLKTLGFRAATLWVLEANNRARAWYERLGWRPTGERKSVYAPGAIDDIGYRLALRGRAVEVDRGDVERWCLAHLGEPVAEELFRDGYLSSVIGIGLASGRRVVVKARQPAQRLVACSRVQQHLFEAGFACPQPLVCNEMLGDLVASAEELVSGGELFPASGRVPGPFAQALATLVSLGPDVSRVGSLEPSPPWTARDHDQCGLWPWPDDRDVDLNAVTGSPPWIDEVASAVRGRLREGSGERLVGHGDWYTGNLRWSDNRLHVAWDWDSVIAASEATIAGLAAAVFPATRGGTEATVEETLGFLHAYQLARGRRFTADENREAWAAGLWNRVFDAKKQWATEGRARSLTEGEARARLRRAGI